MASSMIFEVKVELNEAAGQNLTQQGVREYLEDALRNSPSLSSRIAEISVVPSKGGIAGQQSRTLPPTTALAYNPSLSGFCFCVPSTALIAIGNI